MTKRRELQKKQGVFILTAAIAVSLLAPISMKQVRAEMTQPVIASQTGWQEEANIKWNAVTGAEGYHVYVKKTADPDSTYIQLDNELIRKYSDQKGGTYFRADAVGLAAGNYTMKVVPISGGKEVGSKAVVSGSMQVTGFDRTGFAWTEASGYKTDNANGAYKEDGTLKDNAVVLYVSEQTKNTVSMTVRTGTKDTSTTMATGLESILESYKKGYETRPLDVRLIGQVTDLSYMSDGDILIDGTSCGVTFEGIGDDATAYGWGVRVKNSSDVEIRNIGFMLTDSKEGDDVGLQQDNDHIWVHNCDLFYGEAGGDADQVKGDGAMDCKKSTYITFSYNHFYDNGKCNLLGLSEGTTSGLYITYHHNWYDHSDSRHPRVRFYSAHVYNNYYDGNAKYGIGACLGCSVFAEGNYFRNCPEPMLTSKQGTDALNAIKDNNKGTLSGENGGTIKAFNNYMEGQQSFIPYSSSASSDFDAYVVSSADTKVPASVTSKAGGNTYNNFDTSAVMYSYTADSPETAKEKVTSYAGRVQGGDFKWTFDNSVDDASHDLNTALKAALESYKTSLVSVGGAQDSKDVPATTASTTTAATTTATTAAKTTAATTTAATTAAKTTAAATTTQTTAAKPATGAYDKNSTSCSGAVSTLYGAADSSFAKRIYASPSGKDTGTGTQADPMSVESAISYVSTTAGSGTAILLESGTYQFAHQLTIAETNNGTAGAYKVMKAAQGATVLFDFSSEVYNMTGGSADPANERGIQLNGSYWYLEGITVQGAADNGFFIAGKNNVLERCIAHSNRDSGMQISRRNATLSDKADWPSDNLILNCTSYNNCDPATGENADGFASKLTCGEGNVFDGCISFCNCDDGWDLYAKEATGSIGVVTIRNCVSYRNGTLTDGTSTANGDMNGFKLGGSNGKVPTAHVVFNCLAVENGKDGFTDNGNGGSISLMNCTSYKNAESNFNFYRTTQGGTFYNLLSLSGVGTDKFIGKISNSIYFSSKKYYQVPLSLQGIQIASGDKTGTVVADPFTTMVNQQTAFKTQDNLDQLLRNSDGTINTNGYLMTKDTDQTIGAKFNVKTQEVSVAVQSGKTDPTTPTTAAPTTAAPTTAAPTTAAPTTAAPTTAAPTTAAPTTAAPTTTAPTTAPVTPTTKTQTLNFTSNGISSTFFKVKGSLSSTKGTVLYRGLSLSKCLKMESSTKIQFTAPSSGTLTIVLAEKTGTVNVDKKTLIAKNGVISTTVKAGSHIITKDKPVSVFYIQYAPSK